MVRAGLGQAWRCLFANDFDHKKSRIYRENWGDAELKTADVGSLTTDDLPGCAHLAWASFPCQDLSLAGAGAGLKGDRSGTFWPFWNLMKGLAKEKREPRLVVLENVCGTLTSHGGKDFATICSALQQEKYRVGALVIDAALFVPQSRPRLFVIGVHGDLAVPHELISEGPLAPWHGRALKAAYNRLYPETQKEWIWWKLPSPPERTISFSEVIEEDPSTTTWFSDEETKQVLSKMSDINRAKVAEAKRAGHPLVGGMYKRTRRDEYGRKVQRVEVRFDDIAGCLRTPAGGSSRQLIIVVDGPSIRARLISSRETARLMGLSEQYKLPGNYNEAYHLTGDGVVVPVVRYLAEQILEPVLDCLKPRSIIAA